MYNLLLKWVISAWKFITGIFKSRKIVGHVTCFPGYKLYRDCIHGNVTLEELKKFDKPLSPIVTPIYADEIEEWLRKNK
jgi:hypothetical protein